MHRTSTNATTCPAGTVICEVGSGRMVQDVGHRAPYLHIAAREHDVGEVGVCGDQPRRGWPKAQCLDHKFVVDDGDHDLAVAGLDGSVHDEFVAVGDPGIAHRPTRDTNQECRRRPRDQMLRQVDVTVDVVVGW